MNGWYDLVQRILDRGADPNIKNEQGLTYIELLNLKCINSVTLDGYTSLQFPEAILLYRENGKVYCFDKANSEYLLRKGKNPYTGKKFTDSFLSMLKDTMPSEYSRKTLQHRCPYSFGDSLNTHIGYFPARREGQDAIEDPIVTRDVPFMWVKPSFDARGLSTIERTWIYRVKFKKTLEEIRNDRIEEVKKQGWKINDLYLSMNMVENPKYPDFPISKGHFMIPKELILDIELIIHPDQFESEPRPTDKDKVTIPLKYQPILQGYLTGRKKRKKAMRDILLLEEVNLKPSKPVTLYRGINIVNMSKYKKTLGKKRYEQIKVGDVVDYTPLDVGDSWTTNFCVASHFAIVGNDSNVGVVYERLTPPEDIIIDARRAWFTANRRFSSYVYEPWNQSEMIIKKGNYKVKVAAIIHDQDSHLKVGWNSEGKAKLN
jgi:hypothetical protein